MRRSICCSITSSPSSASSGGRRIRIMVSVVAAHRYVGLAVALAACAPPASAPSPDFMRASAESKPELCMDDENRERSRKIMLEALDAALKGKVQELYEVWLRDAAGQPGRAAKGMDGAL